MAAAFALALLLPGGFRTELLSAAGGDGQAVTIGDSPLRWIPEHDGRGRVVVGGGDVTITDRAGWFRTEDRVFGDFTLRFDVKRPARETRAVVTVFGDGPPTSSVLVGFALPLINERPLTAKAIGSGSLMFFPVNPQVSASALRADDEWQSYEIVRSFRTLSMSLNGRAVAVETIPRLQDGWIGFRTEGGSLAIRHVDAERSRRTKSDPEPGRGVYAIGAGTTAPRPIVRPPPRYTPEAMRARVQGAAFIDCVVQPDGACTNIEIAKSIDPMFGLDREAIECIRRWRFEPGTRRGQAVPVQVTVEVEFALR